MTRSRTARQANTTCCGISIGSWSNKCYLIFIILWSANVSIRFIGYVNLNAKTLSDATTLEAAREDFDSQPSEVSKNVVTSANESQPSNVSKKVAPSAKVFHSNNTKVATSAKVFHSNNTKVATSAKVFHSNSTKVTASAKVFRLNNAKVATSTKNFHSRNKIRTTAKKQDSSNKPTFIIHLGPSKTGTTALQCALIFAFLSDQDRRYFESDKYTYIGTLPQDCSARKARGKFLRHHPGQLFFGHVEGKGWADLQAFRTNLHDGDIYRSEVGSLLDYTVNEGQIRMASEWTKKLHALYAAQHNGILVFEGLDRCTPKHIQVLAESLSPHWNVQIVANYRHAYELLPSIYSEITRIREGELYQFAPDNSSDILPFDLEQRGFFTTMVQDLERRQKHPVEIITERFAQFFDNITLINIHEFASEHAYKEELFCNVIPSMTHTCNALKEHQLDLNDRGNSNPSFEVDYDMLANAAHKQGLIDSSKIQRKRAFSLIKQRQEKALNATAKDFPRSCLPNATIDRLYQLSSAGVQRIFSNSPSVRANHDKGFQSLVEQKKFCHVDTQAVLKDPEWQEFFQRIH
jgi:hypothetical protein